MWRVHRFVRQKLGFSLSMDQVKGLLRQDSSITCNSRALSHLIGMIYPSDACFGLVMPKTRWDLG
jgi:hypothetical protein